MSNLTVINPKSGNNVKHYFIGLIFLFLNKIRHTIQGYITPRTFPVTEFEKAIEYDFTVVEQWVQHLNNYTGKSKFDLKRKHILELGPGADLGVGIILLMKGAEKYNAIDVNNLVKSVPNEFYGKLFQFMTLITDKQKDVDFLRSQLTATQFGKSDKLNYVFDKNFNLSIFKKEKVDIVFSQAAFEHFNCVEKTIEQLSEVVKKGGFLIAEVDLKTHTRWIRDIDPLNIYRYSDFIYNLLRFPGSPNRVRPFR